MRLCGFESDMRAREINGVGTVGLFFGLNRGVKATLLLFEHLDTFEVGIMRTKFLPTEHVEEMFL